MTMLTPVAAILIAFSPTADAAQPASDDAGFGEINDSRINTLCGFVSDRGTSNFEERSRRYSYQTIIYFDAGVDPTIHTIDQIRPRIQTWWKTYPDQLKCDSLDFNVPNGSLLKFAVSTQFDDFLEDMVDNWQVDLNRLDPADGRTLLDYVGNEIVRTEGSSANRILRRYYRGFRKAGALHRDELPDQGMAWCRQQPQSCEHRLPVQRPD